jgi:hypothetical protein
MNWTDIFDQAVLLAEQNPIRALRQGPIENTELELAYRMAQIWNDNTPRLATIHSFAIQISLNLAPKRPITPYSNMKHLQESLIAFGFRFEGGAVHWPAESSA